MPLHLTLYSGPHCSLCDKAKALLDKVAQDIAFTCEVVDIQSDPALFERFRWSIPVIALNGEVILEGKITEFWIRRALAGAPPGRHRLL